MISKIIKVGTSAAVTIPKKFLRKLNLKIGDKVNIEIDRRSREIFITPVVNK